ncbi:hypothetical protein Ddc_12656 [Ditylenchus destructor]|nr:hypothetical protein Ddc_12656 [Ditylenchus destructor]
MKALKEAKVPASVKHTPSNSSCRLWTSPRNHQTTQLQTSTKWTETALYAGEEMKFLCVEQRDRREWTAAGNPRAPSMDVYLEWIVEGWEAVTADMIKDSFKTCGITNSLDGSEDDLIHCFKEAGPVPEGRKLLEDARAGINDEPLQIEDDEFEAEEEQYDSDKTFEFDDMLDSLTF